MTATRDDVVNEAHAWLRTPYLHQGMVKGEAGGVDCAMILVAVYCGLGLVPWFDPRPYAKDWHLHRDEERYLDGFIKYARKVNTPQPADVVLFRVGRTVSHSGIVVDENMMIHAHHMDGCTLAEIHPLAERIDSYWSVFP